MLISPIIQLPSSPISGVFPSFPLAGMPVSTPSINQLSLSPISGVTPSLPSLPVAGIPVSVPSITQLPFSPITGTAPSFPSLPRKELKKSSIEVSGSLSYNIFQSSKADNPSSPLSPLSPCSPWGPCGRTISKWFSQLSIKINAKPRIK